MSNNKVVIKTSLYRAWAQCTCGWEGGERQSKGPAQADAAQHMTDTGHMACYGDNGQKVAS